jgi:hypothetical protein
MSAATALATEATRRKLTRHDLHEWYESEGGEGWKEHRFVCHCGLTRACAMCRRRWVNVARERILKWFDSRKEKAKFVTLTSVHVARIGEITKLMDLAVQLLSWHWPKNFVAVGEFTEPTEDGSQGLWYCHVHAIVVGDYVPQKVLSNEWAGLTGNSYVVDIRKIRDVEKRYPIAYITKYLTKPLENMARQEPKRVVEVTRGLYHKRLLRAHGFKKAAREGRGLEPESVESSSVSESGSEAAFTCSRGIIPVTNPVYWTFLGYELPAETLVVQTDGDPPS